MGREEFISEPLRPGGGFGTAAMAAGLPGLPPEFVWRDGTYAVLDVREAWKASGPERGRSAGERYLRRHYFRLAMSDGSEWVVYFVRQPAAGRGRRAARWFLYSRTLQS